MSKLKSYKMYFSHLNFTSIRFSKSLIRSIFKQSADAFPLYAFICFFPFYIFHGKFNRFIGFVSIVSFRLLVVFLILPYVLFCFYSVVDILSFSSPFQHATRNIRTYRNFQSIKGNNLFIQFFIKVSRQTRTRPSLLSSTPSIHRWLNNVFFFSTIHSSISLFHSSD